MAMIAALGLSMASAPVLAQTAPAARSGAEMVEASGQDDEWGTGTSTTTYIIAFFVVVVIGLGIYFAVDKSDDGQTSP
jgi:branched-subunit amino acid ABC-type transport system permease component